MAGYSPARWANRVRAGPGRFCMGESCGGYRQTAWVICR